MESRATQMAEMLATRLCHDLTGPIGAVSNGAEFLEEEDFSMMGGAVELIVGSAREAVLRLQFYRQAYGRQNATGEASLSEKKQLVASFLEKTKVTLDWPDAMTDGCGLFVSQRLAQVLINLILIAQATLLRGGQLSIQVEGKPDQYVRISVLAEGETVKEPIEITEILRGNTEVELSPKTVQAYLTKSLADSLEADLTVTCEQHSYGLSVTKHYM